MIDNRKKDKEITSQEKIQDFEEKQKNLKEEVKEDKKQEQAPCT